MYYTLFDEGWKTKLTKIELHEMAQGYTAAQQEIIGL